MSAADRNRKPAMHRMAVHRMAAHRIAALAVAVLALGACSGQQLLDAETSLTSGSANGKGVALLGGEPIAPQNVPGCNSGLAYVVRRQDAPPKEATQKLYFGGVFFGLNAVRSKALVLAPGTYSITNIDCETPTGRGTHTLHMEVAHGGTFATFSVRQGEVTDVGVLQLHNYFVRGDKTAPNRWVFDARAHTSEERNLVMASNAKLGKQLVTRLMTVTQSPTPDMRREACEGQTAMSMARKAPPKVCQAPGQAPG